MALMVQLTQVILQILSILKSKQKIQQDLENLDKQKELLQNKEFEGVHKTLEKEKAQLNSDIIKLTITLCDFIPVGTSANIWMSLFNRVPNE